MVTAAAGRIVVGRIIVARIRGPRWRPLSVPLLPELLSELSSSALSLSAPFSALLSVLSFVLSLRPRRLRFPPPGLLVQRLHAMSEHQLADALDLGDRDPWSILPGRQRPRGPEQGEIGAQPLDAGANAQLGDPGLDVVMID